MSTTDNNGKSSTSMGASVGNKIKGAFTAAHGVGENLRGGAMDFVDAVTGTEGRHTETEAGRHETEMGFNQMEGRASAGAALGTTHRVPPPLPERGAQGGGATAAPVGHSTTATTAQQASPDSGATRTIPAGSAASTWA